MHELLQCFHVLIRQFLPVYQRNDLPVSLVRRKNHALQLLRPLALCQLLRQPGNLVISPDLPSHINRLCQPDLHDSHIPFVHAHCLLRQQGIILRDILPVQTNRQLIGTKRKLPIRTHRPDGQMSIISQQINLFLIAQIHAHSVNTGQILRESLCFLRLTRFYLLVCNFQFLIVLYRQPPTILQT